MNTRQEVHSKPKGTNLWDEPWRKQREKTFLNKIRDCQEGRDRKKCKSWAREANAGTTLEKRKGARRKGARRKNVSRL